MTVNYIEEWLLQSSATSPDPFHRPNPTVHLVVRYYPALASLRSRLALLHGGNGHVRDGSARRKFGVGSRPGPYLPEPAQDFRAWGAAAAYSQRAASLCLACPHVFRGRRSRISGPSKRAIKQSWVCRGVAMRLGCSRNLEACTLQSLCPLHF